MSNILFWDDGYGGSAGTAASVAITMSTYFKQYILLGGTGCGVAGMEAGFSFDTNQGVSFGADLNTSLNEGLSGSQGHDKGTLFAECGVEALLRLVASGRLTTNNISNTYSFLNNRLDLAAGVKDSSMSIPEQSRYMRDMYSVAAQRYDHVLLQATGKSELATALNLQTNDLIVISLSQHRTSLDDFFAGEFYNNNHGNVEMMIAVTPYDARSKWSLQNIKRRYNCKLPLFGLPYHTQFADAWNARDVISYFLRYKIANRRLNSKADLVTNFYNLTNEMMRNVENERRHEQKIIQKNDQRLPHKVKGA
jgi:hypothetical protein